MDSFRTRPVSAPASGQMEGRLAPDHLAYGLDAEFQVSKRANGGTSL
jgi:hypothetical protein